MRAAQVIASSFEAATRCFTCGHPQIALFNREWWPKPPMTILAERPCCTCCGKPLDIMEAETVLPTSKAFPEWCLDDADAMAVHIALARLRVKTAEEFSVSAHSHLNELLAMANGSSNAAVAALATERVAS